MPLLERSIFALSLFLIFVAVTLKSSPANSEEFSGFASVQSGNQILIGKRVVRLFGIRAPQRDDICQIGEQHMKCGVVAWSELIRLADGWHVSVSYTHLTLPTKRIV